MGREYFALALMLLMILTGHAAGTQETNETNPTSEATEPIRTNHPMFVGLDIQWAPIHYTRYAFAPESLTERSGNAALVSVEWLPIQRYGKMGIGIGSGFFAQPDQRVGGDLVSLWGVPIEVRLSYHFDYLADQLVVPFASLGSSTTLLRQTSNGGNNIPEVQHFQGWEYAFGGQLCLNAIDRHGAKSFNQNFGVNNTYLTFQFSRSQPLQSGQGIDLSYEVYQLGFRLEI